MRYRLLETVREYAREHLLEAGEAELTSENLGELTLRELIALDPLAAARFASVLRDFKTAADYDAFFASLDEEREPPASS